MALVRAPAVPVAAATIAGIVAGRYGPLEVTAWAVWAGLALPAAGLLLLRGHRRAAMAAALAAVLALAAAHARLAYFRLPADHVVTYAGPARTPSTIRGRIVETPSISRRAEPMGYPQEPATFLDLEVSGILTDGGWRPAGGGVQASVLAECPHLRRGQQVEMVGWLSRVPAAENPGQRDPATTGRRTDRMAAFRVPAAEGVTVLSESSGGPLGRLRDRASAWAQASLGSWTGSRGGMLLEALILGRRDPALADLQDTMARAGIAHLLSISGLHLGIFLGFVYLACRLATLSPRRAALAALACLSGYLLLAEPRSPLLRSAIMAAAVCAGTILGRRHMALNALAVAAVALLAADPMDLFAPGFQLSFAVVAGLVVLTAPVRELLFGRWVRTRGLMVFRGEQRVRRWLYFAVADWAMSGVTVSLLAWLLAAPLLAAHFRLFSPYGAPLTLLACPLVVAAIVPGYVALVVGWAAPNLGGALAGLGERSAEALAALGEAFGRLPAAGLDVQPVGAEAAAWYAALVLVALHRRFRRGRVWAALAAAVAAGLVVAGQVPAPRPDRAELNVLALGAGQCAVLRTPGGRTCLIDAGSLGRESFGEQVLVPFLLDQRLSRSITAFVSHANSDHYNALPALARRGWVDALFLSPYFRADANGGLPATAWRLLRGLDEAGVGADHLAAPRTLRLDPGQAVQVEALWPPPGRTDLSVNDTSLVLRITCDGRSVLLPGDIEEAGQAALAAMGDRVRSDVLVLPHHGGWRPTLPAFVRAVAPEVVVTSAPHPLERPTGGGEAARLFYQRLAAERRCYTTARNGWVQVRFGAGGVEVRTMR